MQGLGKISIPVLFFIIETKDNLDYALKKAYKYWDDTYGNTYGEAQAKVIYYTGKTYLYTRNGGTTTATTTSATTTSATTAKPTTTAETTASTTARTTATSTITKPQTSVVTSTTTIAETTVAPSNVPFIDDYKSKYFYSMLSETQKKWYEWAFMLGRYGEKGKKPSISSEEKGIVSLAYDVSNPHISFYNLSPEDRKTIEEIANRIINKALKETTSYKQIKVIHDELCAIVVQSGGNQRWYELFLNGKGSCWARADAFTYLCQLAGYDCFRVGGDVKDGDEWYGHEWNMIKVDGKWYYVDVTYDGAYGTSTKWFLKGEDTFSIDHVFTSKIAYLYPTASKTDYKA